MFGNNVLARFLMSWRHRNIPKVILNRFGIIHFFIKIFVIFSISSRPWMINRASAFNDMDNLIAQTSPECFEIFFFKLKVQNWRLYFELLLKHHLKMTKKKITNKMSQFLKNLTSSALTPYYSYRAQEICSTSHLRIASRPAARQHHALCFKRKQRCSAKYSRKLHI